MSQSRGIFETFPGQAPAASPFTVVSDAAPASPFAQVLRPDSPFANADDNHAARPLEPGKPAKIPDKRRQGEGPFQAGEVKEGFGFDGAPAMGSPFEIAPPASPFAIAPQAAVPVVQPSPFSLEPAPQMASSAAPAPVAAPVAAGWPQPPAPATPVPVAAPVMSAPVQVAPPAPAPASPVEMVAPPAPAPVPAPAPAPQMAHETSDSQSIRQLELRAIFGVDREMSADEILQRARALPGVKHIARVGPQDISAIETIKHVLANLGFGGGGLRLYAGSVPVDFIREGNVLLAVQTDGGFAPGVRETLMIVARELGRMA